MTGLLRNSWNRSPLIDGLIRPALGWVLFALLILVLTACDGGVGGPALPPPAGQTGHGGEGEDHRGRQRAYFEMMHRAGPDVDWRKVERKNVLAAMARRKLALMSPPSDSGGGVWREVGSRNQSGRIHAAAWSTDGKILYAGADRGGLWKADLDGTHWTPLSDHVFGGVHEIGVIPAQGGGPDILITLYTDWWSEGFVYRSTDGGATWSVPAGLNNLKDARRILVLNDPDHTVFLLVKAGIKRQVLVSKDRGATFVHRRDLAQTGDIWTPRTHPGPVYLVDGSWIYETRDAGLTWSTVGNEIPVTSPIAVLAGSEVPNLRFNVALKANNTVWQLWRSLDGGLTWSMAKGNLANYYDYWQTLAASTQDGDLISYAGTEMFFSRNGGTGWKKINGWEQYYQDPTQYIHADVPGLFVYPYRPSPTGERWYIGTDGGLYDSDDQLGSVRNLSLSGLGVSQYYSVLTSRRKPDIILAGSQDQGYQRAVADSPPPPGPGAWLDFGQLVSGDYGHLTSSNGAHDLVYSVHPMFILVHEGEEEPHALMPWVSFPAGEDYPWMPYIQADPTDPESFFFCATKLYRYSRVSSSSWKYVQHSPQSFAPGFLSAVAFSPLDPMRAWAATSTGSLYHSQDGGVTWIPSADKGPKQMQFYGTALLPSSKDAEVCWVAGSGYSTAPVFRTGDGGVTWEAESDGLPSTLVYCLAEAPDQSGKIFCGSECGAWVYDPHTRAWSDILGAEAPLTTYWACEAVPSKNLIRFGTYSRGIWDYRLDTPGYFPYGELLGGVHVLELKNGSRPILGCATTFEISGCRPVAAGVLAFSQAPGEGPLCGGTLLLEAASLVAIPFLAGGGGEAALTFRMPHDPAYAGEELYFQAAAVDPGTSHGLALSNGLRAVIGR